MIDLFKKEIIWGIITFAFAIIYLFGNKGGRCVAFMIMAVYVAGKLADYFVGEKENDVVLDSASYSVVDDVYCDDD